MARGCSLSALARPPPSPGECRNRARVRRCTPPSAWCGRNTAAHPTWRDGTTRDEEDETRGRVTRDEGDGLRDGLHVGRRYQRPPPASRKLGFPRPYNGMLRY